MNWVYEAVTVTIGLVFVRLTMPALMRWIRQIGAGQMIQGDGPPHAHKAKTPTMGGLLLLCAWLAWLLGMLGTAPKTSTVLLVASLGYTLIGFWDDFCKIRYANNDLGLSARQKLAAQTAVAIAVAGLLAYFYSEHSLFSAVYVPGSFSWSGYYDLGWFYIFWVWLVLTTASNAVNLTDGLDGLVAPMLVIVLVGLVIVLQSTGGWPTPVLEELPSLRLAMLWLLGLLLGFFYYNRYPAQIFMGDSGSLPLGGILGLLALLLKCEYFVLLAGLGFVVNTVSVVIQVLYYKRTGLRFFRMAPLHHHFELMGYHETTVVRGYWLQTLFSTALACSIVWMSAG